MMKFAKIFRLEFCYQLRSVSTWLYFAVVLSLAFLWVTGNYLSDAREGYFQVNAPIVIAAVTVLCNLFWLLIGASVAGDAAARDVQTRMFSLTYTAPARKAEYLGGRLLAAFLLNVIILLAIPLGILAAMHLSGIEAEVLGPFRSGAYLTAFFFILIPNTFIVTAIQFSLAALNRRAMASYLGGVLLFMAAFMLEMNSREAGNWGDVLDPISFTPIMRHLTVLSPIERNTRFIELEGMLLANRVLWLFVALGMLTFTYYRFRFTNPFTNNPGKQNALQLASITGIDWPKRGTTELLLRTRGTFGFPTHIHQLKMITMQSFLALAKNRTGLLLLGLIALMVGFAMPGNLKAKGVPLLPRTDQVLNIVTGTITAPGKFWIIIFLLTIFYAGKLVWRERESGMSEFSHAVPVPEWVLFLSKFLSLSFLLIVCLVFLLVAGVLAQIGIGGADVELGLYLKVLFGFQLIESLLFALLALVVHVLVSQKYLGHLVALLAFGCVVFASSLGIEHKLLIFGSSPGWSYTNMGGFGVSVAPWLWFKAYWVAWAMLLSVAARLLWVRGREESLKARFLLARRRFTRTTAWTTAVAVALILTLGGFIFYNTNILNHYATASEILAGRATYEQRYGKYSNAPQPILTGVNLQVEIYSERREFEVKGSYLLVNKHSFPIDSVHLAIPDGVETKVLAFGKSAIPVLEDQESGFFIYKLKKPLEPGDTLQFDFEVHHKAEGFTNKGADSAVTANFTHIRNYEWLPSIGYQQYRELDEPGLRKKYGLSPRPATASLYDLKARNYAPFAEHISFNAVVGTDNNQMVVAPGSLCKTWTKGGRRYFHYATDARIRHEYALFSARYALYEALWAPSKDVKKSVAIQIYYDPGNAENLERMVRSVKASLSYYTQQFGPYPHRQLRFVAVPGYSGGNHAAPATITAEEGFFLLNTKQDPRGFDLVTAVVAHEVAHQWWGNQLKSAYLEGAGLLSESLAWYSAMGVLQDKYGPAHLSKLLSFLREEYENPRTRAAGPLLRANDYYHNYRKGPFALYALSEYIGKDRVNGALRSLLQKHRPGKIPMATALDLYQELQAVTPDSLHYLLHDLFEQNTFWELETKEAIAKKTITGSWQVTLEIQAGKQVVDSAGVETNLPLNDWVEIGVFAAGEEGKEPGKPLYLQKHYLHSTTQTIQVMVPQKPARAGIDPNHLLIDWKMDDNVKIATYPFDTFTSK
ncbi:M1 family aminopeptidase [Dyadobacter sp. CY323]|uniref:ABC transporter permease/M1 family aminopeptidase n=1 Tax=Dyadobacter sp. CY323 TaxID=2907302 RepID=UPI001F15BC8E|nr:M1 family aminopeptidase [Dyadobacter sp. CY323]MCE6991122.1 ABC transporter permease [Dyadobacter sp. CY323]